MDAGDLVEILDGKGAGWFVFAGMACSFFNSIQKCDIRCKGRHWLLRRDSDFGKEVERVLQDLNGMDSGLRHMRIIHTECSAVLSRIASDMLESKGLPFHFEKTESGFRLVCKGRLSVHVGKSGSERTRIAIRTPEWTKTTSSAATAIAWLNKAENTL